MPKSSSTINIPIFAIGGPTASGKTSGSIAAAKVLNAELVGADSMQVYRKMNIGTDTPTEEELDGLPHHMINVVEPDEEFDAARFAREADEVIGQIAKRGKRVIVVGGTGLYLRVLLRGLQQGPPPNPTIRQEIQREAQNSGWPAIHKTLEKLDLETATRIHPNDGVRILRAMEVVKQTGIPISVFQKRHGFSQNRYPHKFIAIERTRDDLVERIHTRVDQMMNSGFVEEVKSLLDSGYSSSLKPMMGLGYKRLCQFFAQELSMDEAVEKTKTDTRRLAKRQRTWFNGEKQLTWVPHGVPHSNKDIIDTARAFFEEAESN